MPAPRDQIRDFLAAYRHPNAVNGQDWTEADVGRLAAVAACAHRPDPRDRRCCVLCGARVWEGGR